MWYGIEQAPVKSPGSVRIATYNLEYLYDAKDDPDQSPGFDDITLATRPARLAALADAIKRLDADIVAVQELESLECLAWFRDGHLKDLGYKHIYSEDVGAARGMEQGVLSRFPITAHRTLTTPNVKPVGEPAAAPGSSASAAPMKFQRSPLVVQVDVGGTALTLIAVHLMSGGQEYAARREGEAVQVLGFVKEVLAKDPGARIAVLGDFNATDAQRPVQAFAEGGMRNGFEFRSMKDENSKKAKDLYATHQSGWAIDHIFLSPALAREAVDGSYFVLSTVHPPSDYDWRNDPEKLAVPPGYASDHYPVAVDVKLGKQ